MRSIVSFLTAGLLPFLLTACGTFELTVLAEPSSTTAPLVTAAPAVTATAPSPVPPSQCPPFLNETVLPDNPDDPQSYIGHHYNELNMPEGLVFYGGSVLNDDYLTEWVGRPDFDMQFLAQTVCHDLSGAPYNTVVDAVKIPKIQTGYGKAAACSPVPDVGPVIVFGKFDNTQPETMLLGVQGWAMHDIDFGVQINLQTMRFQPLSLEGVQCIYGSGMGS